jgi:hypothetical protein
MRKGIKRGNVLVVQLGKQWAKVGITSMGAATAAPFAVSNDGQEQHFGFASRRFGESLEGEL